jgi:hypothetical protein
MCARSVLAATKGEGHDTKQQKKLTTDEGHQLATSTWEEAKKWMVALNKRKPKQENGRTDRCYGLVSATQTRHLIDDPDAETRASEQMTRAATAHANKTV